MQIRPLGTSDAPAFKELRALAVREYPASFYAFYDEIMATPLEEFARQIAPTELCRVFGAFDSDRLVAIVGLRRDARAKIRHKAIIWGVYTHADYRGQGLARRLLDTALAQARANPEIAVVTLCVNVDNLRAKALYEAVGFTVFGIEPKSMFVDGIWVDEAHMSIDLQKT